MKKTSNFFKGRYNFFLLTVFCLVFQSFFAQNDSLQKSNTTLLEKNFSDYSKKQQIATDNLIKQGFSKIIHSKDGSYSELIGANAYGKPQYFITHNSKVISGLTASGLHSGLLGEVLEGEGVRIGLWENGQPRRAHEMFRTSTTGTLQSRIEYVIGQNTTLQRHATHIAGTIIGNQFSPSNSSPLNNLVKGVAYKSTIKAWDWLNVPLEMQSASTVDHIKIANTSFGLNPIYMHPSEFGRYNEIAQQWDAVMCINSEFQIVKSVGNARDDKNSNGFPQYPQVSILEGYDLLEGAGVAKNVLVIGSVNLSKEGRFNGTYSGSEIQEIYSSWGPTDDGRIKPDLVTHGNNVYSSIETQNNNYGYYSGTSQAAAGVTGGIALLHNYWDSKFTTTMWSSTVRALLIHSVDEIDDKGPDYRHGWGVVNLFNASSLIKQIGRSVIIREGVLLNEQVIKINLAATGKEDLKVTLAWTDPAGNIVPIDINNANSSLNEVTAKLINDLDIKLIRKDSNGNDNTTLIDPTLSLGSNNLLYPWILKQNIHDNSSSLLGQKAQRGDNNRDNIEKIEVYKNQIPTTGGMFQLQISHKNSLNNGCQIGQPFSLIVSGVSFCKNDLIFLQDQDNELADFTGTKVLSNTIRASNIIKAITTFEVDNEDFVEYKAGNFIELLPQSVNGGSGDEGFLAEYGSDFLAYIECTSDDFNQREAFSEKEIESILNDESVDKRIEVNQGEIIVFPNPLIENLLNIQFSLIDKSTLEILIYDLTGKLIFQDKGYKEFDKGKNKKTIDLQTLSSGTYILLVKTNESDHQLKFIKQ